MTSNSEAIEAIKAGLYEVPEVVLDDTENLCSNWLDAGRVQLALFDKYVGSVRAGTDAVAKKAMALAAENSDASLHFARRLMRAKNPIEVASLQVEFYQAQFTTLATQMRELGQAMIKAAELTS
jgi:hypothetical protein